MKEMRTKEEYMELDWEEQEKERRWAEYQGSWAYWETQRAQKAALETTDDDTALRRELMVERHPLDLKNIATNTAYLNKHALILSDMCRAYQAIAVALERIATAMEEGK